MYPIRAILVQRSRLRRSNNGTNGYSFTLTDCLFISLIVALSVANLVILLSFLSKSNF